MLLFFTLVIAICGLLYELMLGTLTSYLIGDSVRQFSFTIGFFMSGMGIGAYMSRYFEKNALKNFLRIELVLSVLGASSIILLKLFYIYFSSNDLVYQLIYFLIVLVLGSLVGNEIPLVATIYKQLKIKTKSVISDIFSFDYIGGLLASLLFPLFLLPYLGLYNVSIFIGFLNLLVAFLYLNYLKKKKIKFLKKSFFRKYFLIIFLIFLYFLFLIGVSSKIENFYLKFYFKEPILQTYQTQYQNIVLTKRGNDLRMFLNGNIQFNSLDENRYHEALIDWPLTSPHPSPLKERELSVLVLGGGDGLAVRNLLKYNFIKEITLVELDPKMIEISKTQKDLVKLNKNSLNNKKVKIITGDAFKFIEKTKNKFDFVVADFPDPRDVHTSKLYSKEFYTMIYGTLKPNGIFVTQASSAFFSTKAFWSIEKTIKSVFGNAIAYHRYLPSFGDWGFVMARKLPHPNPLLKKDRELKDFICPNLGCTGFDEDYLKEKKGVKINTLTKPVIIEYYGEGYKKYNL